MISFLGTVYEIFICVVCVGALPIVNVSIFINMSPVFAVLLAIWVIGEKLTTFNAIQVAASFTGVVLIILGRDSTAQKQEEGSEMLYWGLLVICPLIMAIGEIQTSKIVRAEVNPYFQPFWASFAMMTLFGAYAILAQVSWHQYALTWFMLTVVWSSVTLLAMIFKLLAFRNDKITRVYPIFFFESVVCLLIDIMVFNVEFHMTQLLGILLIMGMFLAKLIIARATS